MCVINPETVVLGGGIMEQRDYLRPLLAAGLERYANSYLLKHTTLAFAALGNSAGMAGAYRLLEQQLRPHN